MLDLICSRASFYEERLFYSIMSLADLSILVFQVLKLYGYNRKVCNICYIQNTSRHKITYRNQILIILNTPNAAIAYFFLFYVQKKNIVVVVFIFNV